MHTLAVRKPCSGKPFSSGTIQLIAPLWLVHVPAPSSPAHSLLLCLAPLCCLVLLAYSSNPCRTEALYRQAVRRGRAIWRSPSGCQPCWPWVAQVGLAQHTFFGVAQLLSPAAALCTACPRCLCVPYVARKLCTGMPCDRWCCTTSRGQLC